MKQIKFLGMALAMVLVMLLTSCLGDSGGNSGKFESFGKMRYASTKLVMDVPGYGTIYSDQFLTLGLESGYWYNVYVEYDLDSPENANSAENGYIHVTLLSAPSQMSQGSINTEGMNLEEAMAGELEMTAAMTGSDYILDDLLVVSEYSTLTEQKDRFYLILDPNQEPTEESGVSVYNAYVRVQTMTAGKTPVLKGKILNVYRNADRYIETIESKEKNKEKTTYSIKFHYVEKINEETGELTWASNTPRTFQIATETN